MGFLKIKEFSEAVGVSVETLRYWDNAGILKPDHRTAGGQRRYTREQVTGYLADNPKGGDMGSLPADAFLKPGEFADAIGVSQSTLRRWDAVGILKPHHKLPSGQRLYAEAQVSEYFDSSAGDE